MKKKYIIVSLISFILFSSVVNAASVSIKASNTSITRGNSVTVTATVSSDSPLVSIEGTLMCKGAGVSSGVDMAFDDSSNSVYSKSYSTTVKPSSSGTISCSVTSSRITNMASDSWQNLGDKTISIKVSEPVYIPPKTYSSNNYLKSLEIEGYTIDFNKDTNEYSIEVPNGTEKVNIKTSLEDTKAKVSGDGEVSISEGTNKLEVKVTAENGNVTNYVLVINKKEKEENIEIPDSNTITNIVIDNTNLVFNKDTLKYDIETAFTNSKLSIKYYIGNDINTKEIDLIVGKNIVNIGKYTINITRSDIAIGTALNNSGIKYNNSYIYGISLNTGTDSLINNVKKISDTLSISVKDKNGNNSSIFKTGDKVDIKSSKEEKNYEVLIYGDVNGDGVIDKLDYLAILRHYYGYKKYDGVYKEAADVNKDGVVDKLDYLAVLRDYYGYKKIVQ